MAILFGDKGVQDARLESRRREGALHDAMVASGALDGDEAITEIVGRHGLTHPGDCLVESLAVVRHHGRKNQDVTIEIGEEELRPRLGTVKANDAEVLRPDLLDAGVQDPTRLAQ